MATLCHATPPVHALVWRMPLAYSRSGTGSTSAPMATLSRLFLIPSTALQLHLERGGERNNLLTAYVRYAPLALHEDHPRSR